MMRLASVVLVAGVLAAPAARAFDGTALSPPASAAVVEVQYAGPMDDGPGYGPPPGYGDPRSTRRRTSRHMGPFTSYHGFRIDIGEAQGAIDVPSAVAEVDHQIDIVDRAGLSPAMLQKFRGFPIRIMASFVGQGSHYSDGPEVYIGALKSDDDRPVLLHEYMHVLHFRFLPGSHRNADIRHFYEEAKAHNLYEPGSYMLTNPGEFFAMTASCYLNGTVARAPYDRATIERQQPDYYAYLSRLFGRGGVAAGPRPAGDRPTVEATLH